MNENKEKSGKKMNKKGIIFSLSTLAVGAILISIVLWQGSTRPQSSTTTQVPLLVQATAQVQAEEDIVVSLPGGNTVVYFPANAELEGGYYQMVSREADLYPADPDDGWTRPYIVNLEYVGTDGTVTSEMSLEQEFRICFTLRSDEWQRYEQTPEDFGIHYYDMEGESWQELEAVAYPDSEMLCADSGKLGLHALAMKAIPLPVTGGTEAPAETEAPYTP